MSHDTLDTFSFPGNKSVCSSCWWWLPSNHFFSNIIKLYIFSFRSKMVHHLKRLICDCLSFTEGLITWLFSTGKEAPVFNRWSTTSVMKIEFSIKHFCNIKLCGRWRFNDKMSVIYCEIACVYILFYIYCFRGIHLFTWQQAWARQRW
jgi:hypothetical protein